MKNKDLVIGIILAGGIGTRFKGDRPKQYYLLGGHEIIWYSIDAFSKARSMDDFIVVVDETEYYSHRIENMYDVKTVLGGNTRNQSFRNALNYIKKTYPTCSKVIENNAACPLITSKQIDDIIAWLDDYDFVQSTYRITDALGSYKSRLVDRSDYFLIQSPDAYRFPLIDKYFDSSSPNGHPATQLPEVARGFNFFIEGQPFKVTYPEDIEIAEILLKRRKG